MACHVDAHRLGKHRGEIYPTCVLDLKAPDECSYAEELVSRGVWDKTQCPHWQGEDTPHKALIMELRSRYQDTKNRLPCGLEHKAAEVIESLVTELQVCREALERLS